MKKAERKKAFLKRAHENKARFELHQRLIKRIFESDNKKLVDIFKEHSDHTGIIGDFLLLGLIEYAEAYHKSASTPTRQVSDEDLKHQATIRGHHTSNREEEIWFNGAKWHRDQAPITTQVKKELLDTDTPEGIAKYAEERICNGVNRSSDIESIRLSVKHYGIGMYNQGIEQGKSLSNTREGGMKEIKCNNCIDGIVKIISSGKTEHKCSECLGTGLITPLPKPPTKTR